MKTSTFAALVCTLLPLALAEVPYSPQQDSLIPPPLELPREEAPEDVDYRIKNVPHYIYIIEKPVVHHRAPYVHHEEGLHTVPVYHHGLGHSLGHQDVTLVNGHHDLHHAAPVVHHGVPLAEGYGVHHAAAVVQHDLPVIYHADNVAHHAVPKHTRVLYGERVGHHAVIGHHDAHVVPVLHPQVSQWQ